MIGKMSLKGYFLSLVVVFEILTQLCVYSAQVNAKPVNLQAQTTIEALLEIQLNKARELRDRNQLQDAIAAYLEILKNYPNQRQAQAELARIYADSGDYESSIKLYQQLLTKAPQNLDLKVQLAKIYSWQGDYQESIELYNQVINQQPNNLTFQLAKAEVLSWQGDYDSSVTTYQQILQQDPSNLQAQLGIAQATNWRGGYNQAIAAYQQILQQNPGNLEARLGIAQAISWQGEYNKAIAAYQQILQQNPDNLEAQIGLADATAKSARFQEALALYNNILLRNPDSVAALKGQAQATFQLGRPKSAITLYQKALERFPRSPEIRLGLARVYLSQQKISEIPALIQPLIDQKNKDALQILREIQAIRVTTDFRYYSNNSGRINQLTELTTRFRINNSNTIQHIKTGFNSFKERNIDTVTNIPIQLGIEGNINKINWRGAVGVDLFNRLPAAFNLNAEVDIPISPNVTLFGKLEQGPYKFNAESLENQITALRLGPDLYWQIDKNTSLYTLFRWGDYNDGNNEQQFFLYLERKLGQFFVGGSLFTLSYQKDTQKGYFAPSDFLLYNGVLGWETNIIDSLRCRLSASLGEQRLEGEFTAASIYEARCNTEIAPNIAADIGYSYSNVRNRDTDNDDNNHTVTGQLRLSF